MNIAFFASSLVSAYRSGAATYYRGIVRALAERGHRVTFYEPDVFERKQHRDIPDPAWTTVVVYPPTVEAVHRMVESARGADLVVKASGVGVHDALLEAAVLSLQGPRTMVAFWDVDAPTTLDRIARDPTDPLRALVPRYDVVFTRGGGPPVVAAYTRFGARRCVPIYNALDPSTHFPVPPAPRFAGALGFLGNRLPGGEQRIEKFFLRPATLVPHARFLLGGAGWDDKPLPANVDYLRHVHPRDHNAFNTSPLAVLDLSHDSTAPSGYAPATRLFEAAGAGACLITDAWLGIEEFLEPEREVLVARDGEDVAIEVASLDADEAHRVGQRARARITAHHTYAHRALDVEAALAASPSPVRGRSPSRMSFAFLGLSITSSWGNGHATTYRSLLRELFALGHDVLFLERDVPWYADNRDLAQPPFGRIALYRSVDDLQARFAPAIRDADVVVVGSYVPDGIAIGEWVHATARGVTAFYDLDTPVTLADVMTGRCEYLTAELLRKYRLYLSFTGGPTLLRLERELGAPCARALYCSVDTTVYHPDDHARVWDLGYMGTYSDDRQAAVQRYIIEPARHAPNQRFVVAGPQYPRHIEWPSNVHRIEHLAPAEHRAFYNRSSFTLNLTRGAMLACGWSPSVRLFEAAACGAPIISDTWHGLDELFEPGREILLVRNGDDIQRYLRDMSETARRELGARGRARVLAAHTAQHRARQLEAHIQEVRA